MALSTLYDLPAPAKLNLFLHVVGRRADGFHLLQSVFVLLDWCDRLHFELRRDGQLGRTDLGPALPADDLSLRAARLLQQAAGSPLGVQIQLDKQVPWGAGLGGGSSDAATTLLALNRLWGLHWPRRRLAELALQLGADVPFFIGGRPAWVEGIGERLTPLPEARPGGPPGALGPDWYAVVKPATAIATPAIFGSQQLVRNTKSATVMDFLAHTSSAASVDHPVVLASGDGQVGASTSRADFNRDPGLGGGQRAAFGRNDLQPPAEALCPDVTEVSRWLQARFGNSRMTGSGSAVFARVGTGSQPLATWKADDLPPTWVGRLCRSLDSHPLVHWSD